MDTTGLRSRFRAMSRHCPQPDQYLTDGHRLFRVVVVRAFSDEELVELEDCATLDVWLVSAEEVGSLEPVRRSRLSGGRAAGARSPMLGQW